MMVLIVPPVAVVGGEGVVVGGRAGRQQRVVVAPCSPFVVLFWMMGVARRRGERQKGQVRWTQVRLSALVVWLLARYATEAGDGAGGVPRVH